MSRFRLFTIGKTEVLLHLATPLFALYAFLTGHEFIWLTATASILVHESAHALAAALLGASPMQIELTPLGTVMRLEEENRLSPGKRCAMVIAGPAASFLLCMAAIELTNDGAISQHLGRLIFMSNLGILLMNLLPALPLDGGRLLALGVSMIFPVAKAYTLMRIISSIAGTALIIANLVITWLYGGWNLSLALAGCCILYGASAATTTQAMAELRHFLDRRMMLEKKRSLPLQECVVLSSVPLRKLVSRLHPRRIMRFTIVEPGTFRRLAVLTEFDAIEIYMKMPQISCGELVLSTKFAKYDI